MDHPRLELDFHQVFERVTDAYVALDRDWRYTYANAKACQLFGRAVGELIGRHIWTEFPEGAGQPFHHAYEQAMAEQRPLQIEAFYPPYNRWFDNRIYPSADGLTIYFHDITERKRAEQLEAGQHEILEGVAAQRPLVESLERIARLHETMNPGALCSLLLLGEDGRRVLHGAAPSLPEAYSRALHGLEIGEAHGSCGTAACRGERVVVADIAGHPYWENYRGPALAHGLKACWSTPVFGSHHEVLGTFAVYFREPREPREEELRSIDRMLPITGIAIESARLVERLHERNRFFDMSQEIFCILDPRSERLLQFNPSLPRLTGYGAGELTSRSYREFLQPEDPGDGSDPMVALGRSGERVHEFVNRCRCRDGSERLLEWVSFAAPDGLVYAVARDITERRRVQAELAHASSHDPVTGLPQHLELGQALRAMLEDASVPPAGSTGRTGPHRPVRRRRVRGDGGRPVGRWRACTGRAPARRRGRTGRRQRLPPAADRQRGHQPFARSWHRPEQPVAPGGGRDEPGQAGRARPGVRILRRADARPGRPPGDGQPVARRDPARRAGAPLPAAVSRRR